MTAALCLYTLFALTVIALVALELRRAPRRPSARALIDEAAGHTVGITTRLDRP